MMTVMPSSTVVRRIVAQTFRDLGLEVDTPHLNESYVFDNGKYVAQSYRVEGYLAMWLLELGVVQFYNPQGDMLRTVNLFVELKPMAIAA